MVSDTVLLLPMLLATTETGPVVAEFGTRATIWLELQLVIVVAGAPLKYTTLLP